MTTARAPVGVYGTGVTGTLLARELPGAQHFGRETSLFEACRRVELLVLAAGPYSSTMDEAVEAAMTTSTHLVHLACEIAVLEKLHTRDAELRRAGIAVVGPAGFSTMVSELLVSLAAKPLGALRSVSVTTTMSRVVPSRGTLESYLLEVERPSFRFEAGALVDEPVGVRDRIVDFGEPFGERLALSAPLPEVLQVGRSSKAERCEGFVASLHPAARGTPAALRSVFMRDRSQLDQMLRFRGDSPGPNTSEREATQIGIEIQVTDGDHFRTILSHGGDPWHLSRIAVGQVCAALLEHPRIGNHCASLVVDAQRSLAAFATGGLRWRFVLA